MWIANASADQFEQWFVDMGLWLRVVFAYEDHLVPTAPPLSRRALKRLLHPVDYSQTLRRVRKLLRGERIPWTPLRIHFTRTTFAPGAAPPPLTPFAHALRDEWIAPVRESLRYRADGRVYQH
jgi:hypothetical protein